MDNFTIYLRKKQSAVDAINTIRNVLSLFIYGALFSFNLKDRDDIILTVTAVLVVVIALMFVYENISRWHIIKVTKLRNGEIPK